MDKLFLFVFSLIFSVVANSESLSGISPSVSGEPRVEGESIKQLDEGSTGVGQYVRGRFDPRNSAVPITQSSRTAVDVRSNGGVQPSMDENTEQSYPASNSQGSDGFYRELEQSAKTVEYVLPKGYKEVPLNKSGIGYINGEKSGTYMIKVPPLLYSVFSFPFKPSYRTPFPDFVTVDIQDGTVMVASKENMPVNIVFFHPKKPSLTVSVFLIPDANKIPANINVSFTKGNVPESERENKKSGVVVDGHDISRIRKKNLASISEYERGTAHGEVLKKINIDVANGFLPEGYELNVITSGPTGVLCGDRRLVGRYVQNMIGELFEVDVFEIKNAGNEYIEFKEFDCYRSGVASIQFNPSPLLKPGSKAELIIVHSKTRIDEDNRLRRPTQIMGGGYAR